MTKPTIAVVLVLAALGCAGQRRQQSTEWVRTVSSGYVGCPANAVSLVITGHRYDARTATGSWQAACEGRVYYCSTIGDTISCMQRAQ